MSEKKNLSNPFVIYLERLEEEETLHIEESVSAELLSLCEQDLYFESPIRVLGKAYFANDYLMLTLSIEATVKLPCSICNQYICCPLEIPDFLQTEEKASITSGYEYGEEIRAALLLKMPRFTECKGGCPERKELEKYLASSAPPRKSPFAEL